MKERMIKVARLAKWTDIRVWLVLQIGLLTVVQYAMGGFKMAFDGPDSEQYVALSQKLLLNPNLLRINRTLGYPFFLQILNLCQMPLTWVPAMQYAIFIFAACLFYRGLVTFGFSRIGAFALTSALLWSDLVRQGWYRYIMTDFLGTSLALLTVALLFQLWPSDSKKKWCLLAGALLASYNVRPDYLFLIVLIPVLGLSFYFLRAPHKEFVIHWKKYTWSVLLASFLPFLLYSTVRLIVVGHFGLVSFGGTNLIVIAGQLLEPRMLVELKESNLDLGKSLLDRYEKEIDRSRDEKQVYYPIAGEAGDVIGNTGPLKYPILDDGTVDYKQIWAQYYHFYLVVRQTLDAKFGNDGKRWVDENAAVSALGLNIVRQRPKLYISFFTKAFSDAFARFLRSALTRIALALFGITLSIFIVGRVFWAERFKISGRGNESLLKRWGALLLLGGAFYLLKTTTVCLVELPLPRYIIPAYLFLPLILILASSEILERIFVCQNETIGQLNPRAARRPPRAIGRIADPLETLSSAKPVADIYRT